MANTFIELGSAIRAMGSVKFHAAMERLLQSKINFDNYLVIAYLGERPPIVLYRNSVSDRVHAEMDSHYLVSLYVLDPFFSAHLDKIPVGAYRLLDIAPDKFRTTSYYREYYQKTTLIDEIAFFAYVTNGWTINICIGRDEISGKAFSKGAQKRTVEIAPTVAALLERHFSISPVGRREETPSIDKALILRLKEAHGIHITPRQAQVAVRLLRGHSSKSIGRELDISWQTVRVFRKQLYKRCRISSQVELFSLLTPLVYRE